MHSSALVLFICLLFLVNTSHQSREGKLKFEPQDASSLKVQPSNIQLDSTLQSKGKVKINLVCSACKYGIDFALWKFRQPDGTYPGLVPFIVDMCKNLKIESPAICDGIVHAMKNETLFLLTRLQLGGQEVCGLIFPSKCHTYGLTWNSNLWTVPIPPKPNTVRSYKTTPRDGPMMKVLHVSDLHIDLEYEPGLAVNCDDPLCCRRGQQVTKENAGHAGYWGSYGYCDTPYWTVENLFAAASKKHYDYILWTGDLPAHDDWAQNRSSQVYLLKNLTALFLKYFPNTPIYPALGNHESDPVNSFPPNYVKGYNKISWLYDALAKYWAPWLPDDAIETVKQSGYYTTLVKPGFRMVSLNMNYCNSQNYWMLLDPVDPNDELKWLVEVLTKAETNGEMVHIIGHIPPSAGGDCLKVWRNNYYNIMERFRDTVTAQFFGHTHTDEFEIIYADAALTTPISMAYICPSVTTYTESNPSYRTYDVASNTWTIVDHQTYILNLTKANHPNSQPVWDFEYSARSEYNMADMSLQSWHQLYQSWLNDSAGNKFSSYYVNYHKGHPPTQDCGSKCKKELLCRISGGNFTNPNCI